MILSDPSSNSRPVIRVSNSAEQNSLAVVADTEPDSNSAAPKRTLQVDMDADLKLQAAKRCRADRTDCGN